VPSAELIELLEQGEVTVKGRMPWSSNATFLTEVCGRDAMTLAVYKPLRGERELWDFPGGLGKREVAAYALSEALGWGIVTETVYRHEGPLGEGSLQRFVPADFEHHYFTLMENEDEQFHDQLRRVCVFDLLANQTDRKSGHCLLGDDGNIYAIDNGLSFHAEFKLRTVIWEFGGEDIPDHLLQDVDQFVQAGVPEPIRAAPRHLRARRIAGPRPRPRERTALPDRRHRPPVSVASCLTSSTPSSTSCCATSTVSSRRATGTAWSHCGIKLRRVTSAGEAALARGRARRIPPRARGTRGACGQCRHRRRRPVRARSARGGRGVDPHVG